MEFDRLEPTRERDAIGNVLAKLAVDGSLLPFPHASHIAGSRLRELRPRRGRSPWRPIYTRIGDGFVILGIAPEAGGDPRGFAVGVIHAEQRLAALERRT